jgi:quinol monooxygenase YgiN
VRRVIVEYIRYDVTDPAAFLGAYEQARTALDVSPHCLAYELTRCSEEPSAFILRIEWDSASGHLQGFRKSPEFGGFLSAVKPFLDQIKEMRHYELTSVVART